MSYAVLIFMMCFIQCVSANDVRKNKRENIPPECMNNFRACDLQIPGPAHDPPTDEERCRVGKARTICYLQKQVGSCYIENMTVGYRQAIARWEKEWPNWFQHLIQSLSIQQCVETKILQNMEKTNKKEQKERTALTVEQHVNHSCHILHNCIFF